jgi:uncharacterized membrane protein
MKGGMNMRSFVFLSLPILGMPFMETLSFGIGDDWVTAQQHQAAFLASSEQVASAHGPPASPGVLWLGVLIIPVFLYVGSSDKVPGNVVLVTWLASSMTMNIMNKKAASSFRHTAMLVIIQMVVADLMILVFELKKLKVARYADLWKWMVIPFFFAGMLATSLWAFKETTLSTVLILRNVLPLCAFATEKYFFGTPEHISSSLIMSMVVTLGGTIVYGYWNLSVTLFGAVLIFANCVITVADRVLQRHFLKNPDFTMSVAMCMLVNNLFGILPMLVFALGTSEFGQWGKAMTETDSTTWFWVMMSGLCGTCIGYLGLRTQKLISATTFLMLQNFNKVALIFFGMCFFGDKFEMISGIGCVVSMLGSVWYSLLRLPAETSSKGDAESEKLMPAKSSSKV